MCVVDVSLDCSVVPLLNSHAERSHFFPISHLHNPVTKQREMTDERVSDPHDNFKSTSLAALRHAVIIDRAIRLIRTATKASGPDLATSYRFLCCAKRFVRLYTLDFSDGTPNASTF